MDIYFCDECAARVTDLDLRAGKGMRARHDTICSGCVDQGLAAAWLVRVGQSAPVQAAAGGRNLITPSASLAITDNAERIAAARDRAGTTFDDPFAVDEPGPHTQLPVGGQGAETDAIPAKSAKRPPPAADKKAVDKKPVDSLAAAGGGFGALIGDRMPSSKPDDDDPVDKAVEGSDPPASASAKPSGAAVKTDNPGKAETTSVDAVEGDLEDEAKPDDEAKPTRTASGRQVAAKRGTSTSKRVAVKPASTRRSGMAKSKGNKVILLSLGSCAVMLIVFFGFVLPGVGKKKSEPAQQVVDEPLTVLKDKVNEAKACSSKALQSDDISVVKSAVSAQEGMMQAFYAFQQVATQRGWTEENYGEQLRLIGFCEAKSMSKAVRDRAVVIEQRK